MSNMKPCNELRSLPFVKTAHLWETIESMEVFKRMPQKPHFKPLRQVKEGRERLAIGHMITFSNMAERASTLKPNDPKNISEDILEVLLDLEKHGFDVRFVRDQVNEVATSKRKQEKLLEEVHGLNNQIADRKLKKSKIDEEITEVNEQMAKLQEKLLSATSAREKEDSEIALLQKQLQKIKKKCKDCGV